MAESMAVLMVVHWVLRSADVMAGKMAVLWAALDYSRADRKENQSAEKMDFLKARLGCYWAVL